ncbi:MAG TPA: methyltransferase domain-containing protein [Nostocaceae cyanobacterium]|nr:methyltransferase domain-containing protein [Nostocaceae cyanobacterium]
METGISQYKEKLLADFNSRPNYDQGKLYTPVANKLVSLANLQSGQKILDVATGTGLVALSAAKIVGKTGKVIGVDISTGMLLQAKEKQMHLNLQNVEFIEADAETIDFSENSFDVIFCSLAACYLTNISQVLKNWYRWLKPGGIIAFNSWQETAFQPSVLFREVAAKYGVEIPNPNEQLGTEARCQQAVNNVGFQNFQIHSEQFGWYYTPSLQMAEDLWRINAKNAFGFQILQLSPEKLQECKSEYITTIQELPTTAKGTWCDALIYFILATK